MSSHTRALAETVGKVSNFLLLLSDKPSVTLGIIDSSTVNCVAVKRAYLRSILPLLIYVYHCNRLPPLKALRLQHYIFAAEFLQTCQS